MDKFYVSMFWKSLRTVVHSSSVIILLLTLAMSYFMLTIAQLAADNGSFLTISKISWLSVTGSVLASTIFLVIQSLTNAIKEGRDSTYKVSYISLVDQFGIKDVYQQRGSEAIRIKYKSLMSGCRDKMYAVGMSNRHFLEQHTDKILEALQKHSVDIVIAFWNPTSTMKIFSGNEIVDKNILDIQCLLENGASSAADWIGNITTRQIRLRDKVKELQNVTGELRIVNISHPANFTSLIIDDDVFFFPFLAGAESTNDPTLHCSASTGVGTSILQHFNRLFSDKEVCQTVYHRKNNENIIDRL